MAFDLTTVFVTNLPPLIDSFGVKGIFSRAGLVKHVFIPKIQGKKFRFGFVSFEDLQGAQNSIRLLNSKLVRGFPLIVEKARGPSKLRPQTRLMPKSSVNKKEGEVDVDLMVSLKKNLAIEIDKIVRKALDPFMGKIEGLIASKCIHLKEGAQSEDNGSMPSFSPTQSAKKSYVDVLIGKRVVDPSPCSVEMVEDSLPHQNPIPTELEEDDFQVKGIEEEARVLKVVESEVAEGEKSNLGSDHELDPCPEKSFFSFNSKPRRKKKKLGKPSARHFRSPSRPGDKRKLPYRDNHASQGSEKRLKCTKEDRLEAMSSNNKDVEDDGENAGTTIVNSNPIISPPSCDVVSQTEALVPSDTPEDSLRARAIRTLNIGARLGVKVVKGERNEEACIRGAMRVIQKQRRYVEQCSSEENSLDSEVF